MHMWNQVCLQCFACSARCRAAEYKTKKTYDTYNTNEYTGLLDVDIYGPSLGVLVQPPPEQIDGSVSDPEQKNTPFSQEAQPGTEGSQNPPLIEGSQNPPPIQVPLQVNSTGVINTTPQLPIVAEQNMVPNENKLIQPLDNTSTDKLSNLPENSEEVGQVSAIN